MAFINIFHYGGPYKELFLFLFFFCFQYACFFYLLKCHFSSSFQPQKNRCSQLQRLQKQDIRICHVKHLTWWCTHGCCDKIGCKHSQIKITLRKALQQSLMVAVTSGIKHKDPVHSSITGKRESSVLKSITEKKAQNRHRASFHNNQNLSFTMLYNSYL